MITVALLVDQEDAGPAPTGELLFKADGEGGTIVRYKYQLTDSTGSTAWQHEPSGASWPPPTC